MIPGKNEIDVIQKTLERMLIDSDTVFEFCRALDRWSRLVKHIRDGYSLSLDDYRHHLEIRDSIEEYINDIHNTPEIVDFMHTVDNAFMDSTTPINRSLNYCDGGPWLMRVPKLKLPDLERGLRDLKFIE